MSEKETVNLNPKHLELLKQNTESMKTVGDALNALQVKPEVTSELKGHKTLVEQMLCEDCNPPEEYKKAHLKLMGQKECKDCGNIDRKEKEYCEKCGEEYGKPES